MPIWTENDDEAVRRIAEKISRDPEYFIWPKLDCSRSIEFQSVVNKRDPLMVMIAAGACGFFMGLIVFWMCHLIWG